MTTEEARTAESRRLGNPLSAWLTATHWSSFALLLMCFALALALRYVLLEFKSLDFYASLKPWYNTIRSEGFAAFATDFSTYNPPYLYLLYLIARFAPDTPAVWAVKLPALVADGICAWLIYLIVKLETHKASILPQMAALAFLFAPSVVLNSAFWGQADSLLTAGLLGWLYFTIRKRHDLAALCFGVALAFKLQAIFLMPVLLALALKNEIPWRSLLVVPVVLVAAIVPSWLAGRPLGQLMGIYVYQTSQFEYITMNAASAYAWLPGSKQVFNDFYVAGVILGVSAAFVLFVLIYRSPHRQNAGQIARLALLAFVLIPFFLPKMHDRYFYPADVLAIVYAFMFPAYFYVPIAIIGVSFFSYQPFLFERTLIPLPVLTGALLVVLGILVYQAVCALHQMPTPNGHEYGTAHGASPNQESRQVSS